MGKKDNEEVLSKAEKFYIENNKGKNPEQIADDLGKSVDTVTAHIAYTKVNGRAGKLLIREKGATIMTQGASEMADNNRNKPPQKLPQHPNLPEQYIHYIKKND